MVTKNLIRRIKAREIIDSNGNPTVQAELETDFEVFLTSVPSGASRGKYEAIELRDKGKRYQGKGVLKAVNNINKIIAPKIKGKKVILQKEIDALMIGLDGTRNKSKLGANAILAVSMAVCRAGASTQKLDLWQYINKLAKIGKPKQPSPSILMIEGGVHAGNNLDIQEFMIISQAGSYKEKIRRITEVYYTLSSILKKEYGKTATNVGFEGGFVPSLKNNQEAIKLIVKAVNRAGHKNKIKLVLDIAASSFYSRGLYKFEGKSFTRKKLLAFYCSLLKKYPIVSLEDPFDQEDWQGWKMLMSSLRSSSASLGRQAKVFIIGDDLTVTNKERLKKAMKEGCINAIVIKPNQIGTVTETIETAKYAVEHGLKLMVSQRGGDTCDDFIADLAVGIRADFIKSGALSRGERVAKYNRLLRIEEEIE